MAKFRKKPVEIEAWRYVGLMEKSVEETDRTAEEICALTGSAVNLIPTTNVLRIYTMEGELTVKPGSWVIKGVKGEFYPCDPEIFEETYEWVSE